MEDLKLRIKLLEQEIQDELKKRKFCRNQQRIDRNREIIRRLKNWMPQIMSILLDRAIAACKFGGGEQVISSTERTFKYKDIAAAMGRTGILGMTNIPYIESLKELSQQVEEKQIRDRKLADWGSIPPLDFENLKYREPNTYFAEIQYSYNILWRYLRWKDAKLLQPKKGERVIVVQKSSQDMSKIPVFAIFDGEAFIPPAPTYFADFQIARTTIPDVVYWMGLPSPPIM